MGLTCSVCGHYENVDLNAEKNYRKGRADPVLLFGREILRSGGLTVQARPIHPRFQKGRWQEGSPFVDGGDDVNRILFSGA